MSDSGDCGGATTRLVRKDVVDGVFIHVIETRLAAAPEAVFRYVADIRRHPEWSSNPMTVERLDEGPARVGSRYRAVGRQGGRSWPSTLVITAYEPPARFAFTATGGPIGTVGDLLHAHEFAIDRDGACTRLTVSRSDPVPIGPSRILLPLITRFAIRVRLRTIERLRVRLEAMDVR